MKIIIAGGRTLNDYELLCQNCDKAFSLQTEIEIVSGMANGADKLGEKYAKEKGYPIKQFPADWGRY
jgi:predicted Rossmann fold nucleotide-binding protein DprA/Smf involved in DNA uptake